MSNRKPGETRKRPTRKRRPKPAAVAAALDKRALLQTAELTPPTEPAANRPPFPELPERADDEEIERVRRAQIAWFEAHGRRTPSEGGLGFWRLERDGHVAYRVFDGRLSELCSGCTGAVDLPQRPGAIYPLWQLQEMLPALDRCMEGWSMVPELAQFLSAIRQDLARLDPLAQARLAAGGPIRFEELSAVLTPGLPVLIDPERRIAGRVRHVQVRRSFFGVYAAVTVDVLTPGKGKGIRLAQTRASIPRWAGFMPIDRLSVRPLPPDQLPALIERGKLVRDIAIGPHYLEYAGSLSIPGWLGRREFRADGRVMIDVGSLEQFQPNLAREIRYQFDDQDDEERDGVEQYPDEDLWMCWPAVGGFSFASKMWGEFDVNKLRPVRYRREAFAQLVLKQPELKDTIRALVEHSGQAFSDLVDGKSGGVIFLLHGPPGNGKTLTAEATAEVLERPLYSISVGELGTEPDTLETRLRQILDMAGRWNAVLLLDEADIFLEQRTEHDIHRNAMVGVFLRLLEYHNGVLFLTTNRVKQFDRAFQSRISISLRYEAMTEAIRRTVWETLLRAAGIEGIDAAEHARREINGRQIKTSIRIAQTLAVANGGRVTDEDIRRALALTDSFTTED
jgi:hypothetical protein